MFTDIHAIIFDHDGTLVDSEAVHLQLWQSILGEHTLSFEEYNQNLSGVPSIDSAQWIIDRFQLKINASSLLDQKLTLMDAFLNKSAFPLMHYAKQLLAAIHTSPMKMAVASGALGKEVHHSLEYHQIHHFFEDVSTGDQVTRNKPAPDVYLLAAQKLGVDPKHCLAIEDSDSGQMAAYHANMKTLRLDTASRISQPENSRVCKDLEEIYQLLKQYQLVK